MEKLCFLGDLFFDYNFIPDDIEKISNFFQKNQYKVILNLEGPLTNSDYKTKKRGPNLSQSKITIDILKKLNVVGVCLANNHIMDYGEKALQETISILQENNIKYCGAGLNIEQALEPMIIEISGKRVAITNCGWNIEETVYATKKTAGAAPRKANEVYKQLEKAYRQNVQSVIVTLHWGFEYNLLPMPVDIGLAHNIIDNYSKVDMIIGHHPHTMQAYEIYKNKNIYYSLGNFYFASRRDRFKDKRFNSNIENMCDFGLGVVYDPNDKKIIHELIFEYNSDKKETLIIQRLLKEYVEDITNVDYDNKEYINRLIKYRQNINPILTKNKLVNFCKLTNLHIKYLKPKIVRLFPFLKGIKRRLKKWKN